MVLINGRKFACEACIRGHRASSCAHTGRQLQLVRPKGRPSSQCDVCRAKRAQGNFHGRCDCMNDDEEACKDDVKGGPSCRPRKRRAKVQVETFTPYFDLQNDAASTSAQSTEGSAPALGSSVSRHSLQSIMNPCACRTTGFCSCCGRKDGGEGQSKSGPVATKESPAMCGCNGSDVCCADNNECKSPGKEVLPSEEQPTVSAAQGQQSSCCKGKAKGVGRSSIDGESELAASSNGRAQASATKGTSEPTLLTTGEDLSFIAEEHASIMSPECQCGPTCSCPDCINDLGGTARQKRSTDDGDCPIKCVSCSACVMGLTRPSGIAAVDEWMERDKGIQADQQEQEESAEQQQSEDMHQNTEDKEEEAHDTTTQQSSSPSTKQEQKTITPPPLYPSRPPTAQMKHFFSEHFQDSAKRKFFADHIASMQASLPPTLVPHLQSRPHADFGKRIPGESDEQWKSRHGFRFLTPETIAIFDHAKKFREEKRKAEEAEDRKVKALSETSQLAGKRVSDADDVAKAEALSLLRAKALAARRTNAGAASTAIHAVI